MYGVFFGLFFCFYFYVFFVVFKMLCCSGGEQVSVFLEIYDIAGFVRGVY